MARGLPTPDLTWVTKLRDELQTLPATLQTFRETVQDLRKVAGRLEAFTEVLERTERHLDALGVTDTARQLDDAVVALEKQMTSLRNARPASVSEGVEEAVAQVRRTTNAMADLGSRMLGGGRSK